MRKQTDTIFIPKYSKALPLKAYFLLAALFLITSLTAQQTVLYQSAELDFSRLVKEFDQGLYGRAARSADKFLSTYLDPSFEQFQLEAELYRLKSWLRMDKPGTIQEILHFSDYHQPEVVAQQAIMIIGENAFDNHQYDDAIKYLTMVNADILNAEERSARSFKLGYSLFIRKDFDNASAYFDETKDVRNKYYYPANYYYGMTQYFKGNYNEAIRSFELVAPSDFYKDYIPYYITQIHFNNNEYQKVIGYGNQSISSPTVLNKAEIRQLIGQAYFETGDYASAIPHLAYVNQHSDKLREDDFYQLGISYYKTGDYQKAISVFLEIRNQTGVKAHYANYYLGQSYLKTGDKTSARNSLMNASKMEDVPSIKAEATYHYGRLSAEAGDDVEAIRVLQTIPSSSPVYTESQNTLAGILTNTGDYSLAVRELEAMKNLSPTLKTAYQKVTLFRAEQFIQEGNDEAATELLDKSLKQPYDKAIQARALFWKGEIAHLHGDYAESIKWYDQYFALADNAKNFPPQQSRPIAQYNQGYNYLRTGDFIDAQSSFENAVNGIEAMSLNGAQQTLIKNQIFPDAVLRAGDASFKRNQYDKANQYYDQSIRNRYPGYDYAKYQKAIIKGLQKKPQEKIALLEELADGMPESLWADDALYQAGNTYQEENQLPKAIKSYEKVVSQFKERSPLLHPALLRLGLLSYNTEQYEASLRYYKSVFQYNPDPQTAKEAMSAIQEIYVNQLDTPQSFFDFAGTIPGFSVSGTEKDSILYSAAENHYANGDYDKAATSFQQYIDQNPTGSYTLKAKFLKAESLSLQKRYSDALSAYEVVIKLGQSPYLAASLYKAALISYNQQQDMARAFTYYSQYIPLAETDEQQYDATLGALRSAFKLKKADDVYSMAAKIIAHPKATDDIRALAHYYSATLAIANESYAKAIESFNAIIRINSAELAAEARYQIAFIYSISEVEIAAKLAEEAARANVGYPFWVAKSLILLSDIKLRQGDLLNARAILEAIIENFQGDETIMKEANEKLEKVKTQEEIKSRIKPTGTDTLELQNPHKD
ncbi:MAG TPA: tetratricopeptide repeat protein [Saprospiraceae bacterium]|nr:tetratricopeptide repeat protein [Saprospiraceae bacterium]